MHARTTPPQHRSTLLLLLVTVLLSAPHLPAQSTPPPTPAKLPNFDIVSVKPNKSGSGSMRISTRDGSFDATNITLKNLLLNAYSLKEAQLLNLPAWGESAHFDIQAKVLDPDMKVLDNLTDDQRGSMLQAMLVERFGLKSHTETAILPVYELVLAKGGAKFKPSEDHGRSFSSRNTEIVATGVPISSLVSTLSSHLGRMVVDKTGLPGQYDISLKWTPDDASAPLADNAPPPFFTAIQEQLGLKLIPAKAPVQTFVIDHVEMPSEN